MCVLQKSKEETLNDQVRNEKNLSKSNQKQKSSVTATTYLGTSSSNNQHMQTNAIGQPLTIDDLKFSITLNELNDLMKMKGHEAFEKLENDHGGLENLAKKLKTNLNYGIDENVDEIARRIQLYGRNQIPSKSSKSIFILAFEAIQDTTLIMLILCSFISIGLSFYNPSYPQNSNAEENRLASTTIASTSNLEWVEGAAILVAVLVVVFVTAFNDWRKEKQFRALKDRIETDNLTSVIREGVVKQVNVKDLVVGDVCCVKYGDLVPADGIVTQASDLKIDESSLTGESNLIQKSSSENITILSGTHVMEGSGNILVLAVGVNSQTGIIMALLGGVGNEEEPEEAKNIKNKNLKKNINKITPDIEDQNQNEVVIENDVTKIQVKKKKSNKKHRSVLQIKLGKLALQIGYGGMIAALFTFVLLLVRMAIEEFAINQNQWSNIYIKYIISYLIQAITVIVVAVPEGLPLAVTLALAFAVRKMTKDNNLVRHLDACETMGNATTICSDKTGTLTTNRMTAVQCWVSGILYKKIPESSQLPSKIKETIFESISLNSNYTSTIEPCSQLGELPKQIGNKTECGLLGFVDKLGGNYAQVRNDFPSDRFVKCYTFNSARKMMSTIIKHKNGIDGFRLHSKGASEIVLKKCSFYLGPDGVPIKLTSDKIDEFITTVVEKMALDGLRTICVAYRDFLPQNEDETTHQQDSSTFYYDEIPDWNDEENIIENLTCICLVGIEDPVRPEVPEAIRKCQKSGVVVRMVTGDNLGTARSIAMKCGIIKPNDDFLILESKEFNRLIRDSEGQVRQELLDQVWPRLRVLARSSPQDKYILVNGIVESKLSSSREVVAVTGDGTNDGPALKRADVGFAMGIQGTDVAKEASDIILTDDNFNSIVKAMLWGRNVYDAIAKFLQFQLTANFTAGIFSVVCAATIQAVPLKAVQMLWVNLVMDTLASLALATEPPTEDLLNRKPYGRDKSILSFTMIRNILFHSIYQLVILLLLVFKIDDWMDVPSVLNSYDISQLLEPSIHFTIVFNAFVLMTLFNEINSRKIHNERNVLSGILKNKVFLGIWISSFIGQLLIVNFGGIVFGVVSLSLDQWIWCLFLGFGSLVWNQIVICIPVSCIRMVYKKLVREKKVRNVHFENGDLNLEDDLDEDEETIEKSKVLWIRGANRIQNQIRVVEAFQQNGNILETCTAYGSMASLKKAK